MPNLHEQYPIIKCLLILLEKTLKFVQEFARVWMNNNAITPSRDFTLMESVITLQTHTQAHFLLLEQDANELMNIDYIVFVVIAVLNTNT